MSSREFRLHNGKKGSALAVRVTPRASQNQVVGVLNDGTIKVHLTSSAEDADINTSLMAYLSNILEVPRTRLEIVAGENGRDKLISVLDMDTVTVHKKIVEELGKA